MAELQITSRQFREKQMAIFELADKGEKIIFRRGDKQAYVLVPVDDDDLYFTPEVLAKIDKAVQPYGVFFGRRNKNRIGNYWI